MQIFQFLFILLLFGGSLAAGPILLITGASSQTSLKFDTLQKYTGEERENYDNVKNLFNSNILIADFNNVPSLLESSEHVDIASGLRTNSTFSAAIVTKIDFQSMSEDEIEILGGLMRTQRSLQIIDLDNSDDTTQIINRVADCTSSENDSVTIYTCGGIKISKERPSTILPVIFAEAAKAKPAAKTSKKPKVVESEELEEEIQEIVKKAMKKAQEQEADDDDDDDDNEFDNKHDPKRDHRLHCKYRKSCYESGKRGLIERYDFSFEHLFHFWRAPPSQQHHLSKHDDADQDGIPDNEDDDVSLADRKLVCKYRTSCYKEHEIPISEKLQERERSFISAKLQVPQGKKRTLKDIANKAVSGVEERMDKAKSRPISHSMVVEKKLQEIEDKLQAKLDCKYRKSCYETGVVPEIEESSFHVPFLTSMSDDEEENDEEEKDFDEMENLERKHYCKYRKSCYETGKKPVIEPEIHVESIRDLFDVADQVETRKLTVQERCKYRKSCYETGVLPELGRDEEHIEKAANKQVSSVVPSTVKDLKSLCKYRKSCYEEIAVAPSTETVQEIRKRRIVEKEVRKRRTRRHRRLHRKRQVLIRYGMTAAGFTNEPVEKTQKELQDLAEAKESRKQTTPQKSAKDEGKKASKSSKIVEDVAEDVVAHTIVEAVNAEPDQEVEEVPVKKSKKSSKKVKAPEPEPEETEDEPEVEEVKETPKRSKKSVKVDVPEPVVDDAPKKQGKKQKKPKEPEPEKDEPVPEPEEPKKPEKRQKKVKKADPEPEAEEDEQAPEPEHENVEEPEEPKKQEKKQKKVRKAVPEVVEEPEDVEEPVAVKITTKTSEHDEDDEDEDDDNEFDNKHDPKRDHRLHCKYRRSCYETGKRGLIEPYDFSIDHLFHFWRAPPSQHHEGYHRTRDSDGDGIPDIDDKDTSTADKKLLCKYRKSCYETGEHGLIEPYDFSLYHIFHFWRAPPSQHHEGYGKHRDSDGDGIPDLEDEDTHISHKKLSCKYRASCYEKYDIPVDEKFVEREQRRTFRSNDEQSGESDDSDGEDDSDGDNRVDLDGADRKLNCKYRKSCYDSGVLPTIQQWSEAPSLTETIASSVRDQKMTKCKYRKSCYAEIGINEKDSSEGFADKDEERKKEPTVVKINNQEREQHRSEHHGHQKKHQKKRQESEEEDDNDEDEEQEQKAAKKKHVVEEEAKKQEVVNDEEHAAAHAIHLNVKEKSSCKYRKSCYSSIEPKATRQDHSGSMARRAGSGQKCHIYYLSCREAMGLPPKEKAPIGPNGKRLCRRKK